MIDAAREPFAGIGKPEPLRGGLSGDWSRRIDEPHRLVYRATDTERVIIACRFHDDGWAGERERGLDSDAGQGELPLQI